MPEPWTDLKQALQELPPERLIELFKGLHGLSSQNKAWLRSKVLPVGQDSTYLEECCQKVIKAVYNPARKFPDMPRFREAKKVISEYRKSTKDLAGTLDLMLTYVERGHDFTNDFGDIDMPFYDALINMLERFAIQLKNSPARRELYDRFRARLLKMNRTADIGWGYGDFIHETVDELEAMLGN
ncbi:MAG: hypothetical protein ACOYYU_20435 [Chloroflexota bacterium]